jgi:hypothetical protein
MLEVGRLREVSFREAGGGSGKIADIDEHDTGKYIYKQLIVWNPEDEEIVGGYRYAICSDVEDENGIYHLSTAEIFEYSEKLKKEYFPYTIELGRSFVQPQYQPSLDNRKTTHPLFVMPLLYKPQRFGLAVEQPDDTDRASFKVLPVHLTSPPLLLMPFRSSKSVIFI